MSNQPSADPSAIPQSVSLLLPRFLGRLIDGLILGVPMGGLFFVIGLMGLPTLVVMGLSVLATAVIFAYFVLCDMQFGGTIGKMAMGLRVVGSNGQNPDAQEACKRECFNLLQIIPVVGGLIQFGVMIWIAVSINSSPTGQGVHDTFAGTRVTRK